MTSVILPSTISLMRVGISGTHDTGKTTLAEALCAHLPGHVAADEPYYLLEEEGYEFGFPPIARGLSGTAG